MAQYDTAKNVINAAAAECGLGSTSDPFASTDPSFIQLVQLLTNAGQELNLKFPWEQLIKKYSITTVVPGDTGDYALPSDFGYMIDQSGWEATQRYPLGGPLDSQDWQMLTNNNTLASIYISFRISQMKFRLFPQPPANGLIVNFEYVSRWWVCTSAAPTTPAQDSPLLASDIVYIDRLLMVKKLKVMFLEARGFDSTSATKQMQDAYDAVTSQNMPAPVLSLDRKTLFPYLGERNVPTTRYGL
jgi:hypothetical protein